MIENLRAESMTETAEERCGERGGSADAEDTCMPMLRCKWRGRRRGRLHVYRLNDSDRRLSSHTGSGSPGKFVVIALP